MFHTPKCIKFRKLNFFLLLYQPVMVRFAPPPREGDGEQEANQRYPADVFDVFRQKWKHQGKKNPHNLW